MKIRTLPAISLVVASMVGTGVFTSLGYQVGDIPSGPGIVLLWVLGGLVALCGAFSYAELASGLPKSGGEYHFLGSLYHPSLGWAAGLLSAIVGFAAPTALATLALGSYAQRAFAGVSGTGVAVAALYVMLNVAFLKAAPVASLAGSRKSATSRRVRCSARARPGCSADYSRSA
jgi:APA family basic amino acid/polyamine antiporter